MNRALLAAAVTLTCALAASCADDPPPAATRAACPLDQCGITCFDPDACGGCGNGVCDWYESLSVCPSDCCDASACDPTKGEPYVVGDPMCVGAPDGKSCDDGDAVNGAETCRGGVCRHEHAQCRCAPAGGIYARPPARDPDTLPPPPAVAADPPWSGPTPAEESFTDAWALRHMDVSRAWARTRGDASVRVGIVDSGCDESLTDLAGRVVATRDFTPPAPSPPTGGDHGTFLASIVAADDDGTGVVGVAPRVSLVCARVLRADDEQSTAADPALVAEGIDWVVSQGAKVVLVGLAGHGSTTAEVERAVAAAVAADVLVVAPAGSLGGANADGFPAALPGVVSVGGSDLSDLHDSESDLAPTTLLLAPGRNVVGSYRGGTQGMEGGASVAAAFVAGAAALVRSAEPSLRAPVVRALLHAYATPIALDSWEDFCDARRLNIGEVVTRASPALTNVAVADTRFAAESALPESTLPVRVRVENRGAADAHDVRVSIVVTGGTATTSERTVATLALGATELVTFDVTPSAGATEVSVAAHATLTGDLVASDDDATGRIPVSAAVHHRLRVARAWIDTPEGDVAERTVHVRIENAGNAREPAGELRVAAYPGLSSQIAATPALAPGERAELTATVSLAADAPEGHHTIATWLLPARGQTDLTASSATLQLAWRRGHPELARSYMQHKGYSVIIDAPWRTIRPYVPVLIYYAQSEWQKGQNPEGLDLVELIPDGLRDAVPGTILPRSPAGNVEIERITITNPSSPNMDGPIVFEDDRQAGHGGPPRHILSGTTVRDENGVGVGGRGGPHALIVEPALGAHRIVWLPRAGLQSDPCSTACYDHRTDPHSAGLWLRGQVDVSLHDWQFRWDSTRTSYRTMFVETGTDPLPVLSGQQSHYYDPHFHSIAETWPGTYPLGPAKNFGGPLAMMAATAYSLGIIADFDVEDARDQVVTTDHNTFFDDEFVAAGPTNDSTWGTRPALVGNPTADRGHTGSREMDRYRALLGSTVGEEVSLRSRWSVGLFAEARGGIMGNHALLYQADYHVNGTWGTADVLNCTPDVMNYLTRISGHGGGAPSICASIEGAPANVSAQSVNVIGGFTFAAHPFSAPVFDWDDAYMREALSLAPMTSAYFRQPPAPAPSGVPAFESVLRGLQFWNGREAQVARASDPHVSRWTLDERHQNPYVTSDRSSLGPWQPNCGAFGGVVGYRGQLGHDLGTYLGYARDAMQTSFSDVSAPRPIFIHKIFTIAGSDAHGDFGFTSDILSTRASRLPGVFGKTNLSDSAYARCRTYVFSNNPTRPASLEDMRRGRAVLTDGPVVEMQLDADTRGTVNGFGRVMWDENEPNAFDDADGFMGGDGVLDATGTMFVAHVPNDSGTQHVGVRMRCTNLREFGGTTPTTVELWATGTPGTDHLFDIIPLRAGDFPCDGAWHHEPITLPGRMTTSTAILAHVSMGENCPGTYDAITNPVWAAPVTIRLGDDWALRDVDSTEMQRYRFEGHDVVELEFPISMSPDQQVQATLYGINSTTGTSIGLDGVEGTPAELVPSPDDGANANGWAPSADGANPGMRLRVKLPTSPAFETSMINPSRREFRMLLVVRRRNEMDGRLLDYFGNPIDEVMVRFRPRYVETTFDFTGSPECCGDTHDATAGNPMAIGAQLVDTVPVLVRASDGAPVPSGYTWGSTTVTYTRSRQPASDGLYIYDWLDLRYFGSGSTPGGRELWTFRTRWSYDTPTPGP